LLRVARLDAIALDVSDTIDLSAAAQEVVAYMAPSALANGRLLAAQGTERLVLVSGNRHAIEEANRNLVENAIAYAPANTEVVVSVDERDPSALPTAVRASLPRIVSAFSIASGAAETAGGKVLGLGLQS
jgi:signal transduction histidine kinase